MKQLKGFAWIAAVATVLFSFSVMPGTDHYEVYLNSKLLLKHYVTAKATVPGITLDPTATKDELSVFYSHCGKTGTGRHLSIRDAKNHILKEWPYADTPAGNSPLPCPVKEITALLKGNPGLGLFYSSRELPEGRLLVNITMAKGATTVSLNH